MPPTGCKGFKVAGYPKRSVWVSAVLIKTRGGAGYLKAMSSAKVLIEGLGLACIFMSDGSRSRDHTRLI